MAVLAYEIPDDHDVVDRFLVELYVQGDLEQGAAERGALFEITRVLRFLLEL